jgi:hypothetical protein
VISGLGKYQQVLPVSQSHSSSPFLMVEKRHTSRRRQLPPWQDSSWSWSSHHQCLMPACMQVFKKIHTSTLVIPHPCSSFKESVTVFSSHSLSPVLARTEFGLFLLSLSGYLKCKLHWASTTYLFRRQKKLWMCHQHHGCLNLPISEEALFFQHRFLPPLS